MSAKCRAFGRVVIGRAMAMGHGVTVVLFSLTISDPRGATLVYVLFIFLRTPFQTTAAYRPSLRLEKKNKKYLQNMLPTIGGVVCI